MADPLSLFNNVQAAVVLALLSASFFLLLLAYPRRGDALHSRVATLRGQQLGRATPAASGARKRTIAEGLRGLEGQGEDKKKAPTLEERIAQAGLSWSPTKFYIISLLICVAGFALAYLVLKFGSVWAIGYGVSGALAPRLYVSQKRKKRLQAFESEFPHAIDVIVRGVRAGLPLADCLKIIAAEAQEPVRSEFRMIIEDQAVGLPIDQAVERLAQRIPTAEANFFAIVVAIQSRSGGNLSEALGNLSNVLRERQKMRLKIRAVSSEARASAMIIGSMPFGVAGMVYLTSPQYIRILFVDPTGQTVLIVCGVWMGIGVLVMRKMINFDF